MGTPESGHREFGLLDSTSAHLLLGCCRASGQETCECFCIEGQVEKDRGGLGLLTGPLHFLVFRIPALRLGYPGH